MRKRHSSSLKDKKERNRVVNENESGRHWHEEERDTGILGQRDCTEEDRHADNDSNKESAEGRGSTSADRWNDAGKGSSGLETRREGRWSTRWGPDDKEKDSWSKTRISTKKEDSLNDNKSSVGSTRTTYKRGTDSRDKWRPHHRLEVHSSGPLGYRTSPGFGIERGRLEGSNVGFARGRGRSSILGNPSPGRPSLTLPIGAPLDRNARVFEKLNLSSDTFRYSSGKLLDIYRKQSLVPSFNDVPKGLEEVFPITELNSNIPLAFISPGAEEEAVLSDIFKGKPTNRGILCNPSRNKIMCSDENVTGIGEMTSSQRKHGVHTVNIPVKTCECFRKVELGNACGENARDPSNKESCVSDQLKDEDISGGRNLNGILSISEVGEHRNPNNVSMFKQSKVGNFLAVPVDSSTELPDDSGILFDKPASEEVPVSHEKYSRSKEEANLRTRSTSLKELSLYYKDPLGVIQGPFLAVDIISGFDQGFFGTDLLVRLSDAPEGTPLQELGDVITYLKSSAGCNSTTEPIPRVELFDSIVGTSTANEFHDPAVINEHRLGTSDVQGLSVRDVYSGMSGNEEFMFPGQPGNDNDNLIRKKFGNHYDTLRSATTNSFLANGAAETSMLTHKDDKPHMKRTLLSKSASESDQAQCMNPNVLRDSPFGTHEEHSFGVTNDPPFVQEVWSGNHKSDTFSDSNSFPKSGNGHQSLCVEQDSRIFEHDSRLSDLAEQLNSRKLQNNQYQKHTQFSPFSSMHLNAHVVQNAGLSHSRHPVHPQLPISQAVSDLEHLVKLHVQRQRQFQVQKHHMEQQQLHHQNMQLRHHQNSQIQQLRLKQLLHQQMCDPGYEQSGVDSLRDKTMLDQVLRQNVEQGGMHHSRPPSGHPDPKLEQVIQAKSGQGLQRELLDDLYGQVLPSELQRHRQQEQMQASLYFMVSRNKMAIDEGCNHAIWSVEKIGQFAQTGSNPLLDASTEISPFNYHQQQNSPFSCEEHLNFGQNLKILERQQRGIYEQNLGPFERSRSLPACGPGMNLDIVDALACEGLDLQEMHNHIHSACRMDSVISGIYDHHPQVPRQFHSSNKDANEGQSCVKSGDSMDSYLQLQIGREKREVEVNMSSKGQSSWFPTIGDDESSNPVLLDLLHRQMRLQTAHSFEVGGSDITSSSDRRDSSWFFPGSSSSSYSYNNLQSHGTSSSVEGRQSSNLGNSLQNRFVKADINHHSNSLESSDRLFNRSHSGPPTEEQFSLGLKEAAQALYRNADIIGTSSVRTESRDRNQGVRGGFESWALRDKQLLEIQGRVAEQSGIDAKKRLQIPAITPIRHDKLGITDENIGFCDYNMGMDNRSGKDMAKVRVSLIPLKGFDDSSLPLWDTSSPLREPLSELDSNTTSERKSAPSFGTSDGKSDSSIGGLESSDSTEWGRSGIKKGDKGKQTDQALLGFKVSRNGIVMVEIQRLEELHAFICLYQRFNQKPLK
ncbi:hypothetical protein IFM89_014316, partial [Coptis chinensis]